MCLFFCIGFNLPKTLLALPILTWQSLPWLLLLDTKLPGVRTYAQLLTGEILTFTYAYNQTQSTDIFTHIESNAKLHENCIFFVFYHLFYYLYLFYIKIIYLLLFVIVLLPSFSLLNDNLNNMGKM